MGLLKSVAERQSHAGPGAVTADEIPHRSPVQGYIERNRTEGILKTELTTESDTCFCNLLGVIPGIPEIDLHTGTGIETEVVGVGDDKIVYTCKLQGRHGKTETEIRLKEIPSKLMLVRSLNVSAYTETEGAGLGRSNK